MTASSTETETNTPAAQNSCCGTGAAGHTPWYADRRLVIPSAIALGGGALWFGWPWLVVAGLAPLIVALLPCLIMCGAMCALKACSKPKQGETAAGTPNPVITGLNAPAAATPLLSQAMLNHQGAEDTDAPATAPITASEAALTDPSPQFSQLTLQQESAAENKAPVSGVPEMPTRA